jgi:hypothetical protein
LDYSSRRILVVLGRDRIGDAECGFVPGRSRRPRFLRDLKFRARERGTDLGDELLGGVGLIAEALAELAVKAVLRAGPVRLMPISA